MDTRTVIILRKSWLKLPKAQYTDDVISGNQDLIEHLNSVPVLFPTLNSSQCLNENSCTIAMYRKPAFEFKLQSAICCKCFNTGTFKGIQLSSALFHTVSITVPLVSKLLMDQDWDSSHFLIPCCSSVPKTYWMSQKSISVWLTMEPKPF